jgi:radical SAM-linked protein
VRARFRFTKAGKVRFLGHRDLARVLERGLRRAGVPVAYSEGFSPRPRLSFGLALPTGFESDAEYFDADLQGDVDPAGLLGPVSDALPPGIDLTAAMAVPPGAGSLQQLVTGCSWRLELLGAPVAAVSASSRRLLDATALPLERQRKGKTATVDVRPQLRSLRVEGPTVDGVALLADLDTEPVAVRPSELVELLGGTASLGRGRRLSQWITVDGARTELPPVPAASTRHAQSRAS